jgi:hypothetical protein
VTSVLRRPAARFTLAALVLVAACCAVVRSRAFAMNPDVAAWGVTFDLTISAPLLYWFFVVRNGRARPLTIAPVFLAGSALAALLLPRAQQQFLHDLGLYVGSLAELALIGALVQRIVRMRREGLKDADPYVRISTAARAIGGDGRAGDAIASEVAMIYYALFVWRKREAADDERSMTFHRRHEWSTIVICLLVLIAFESVGVHLLLMRWSTGAAWFWTAMDVWAMVWLIGDYHALRLRRTTFDDETLELRYGMRWSARIALDNIAAIEEIAAESEWKQRGVLKVAILDAPRWLITLREPVIANGLAGLRKSIRAIALLPDDETAISALRRALASRSESAARR